MPKLLIPGDKFRFLDHRFTVLDINMAKGDILCIADRWRSAPFDDETRRDCTNDFGNATIKEMLGLTYFASLLNDPEDKELFIPMAVDLVDNYGNRGYEMIREYVRLLTQKEMVEYRKYLDIRDWAWTMTPYRCKTNKPQNGDHNVAVADSYGRWGHHPASSVADIYPVVLLKQKITLHSSFRLIK